MGFWYYFWTLNFLVAGSAFLIITLVVLVRGSIDLRDMFARLNETSKRDGVDHHIKTSKL